MPIWFSVFESSSDGSIPLHNFNQHRTVTDLCWIGKCIPNHFVRIHPNLFALFALLPELRHTEKYLLINSPLVFKLHISLKSFLLKQDSHVLNKKDEPNKNSARSSVIAIRINLNRSYFVFIRLFTDFNCFLLSVKKVL